MSDSPITLLARKAVFRNAVFTVYAEHIRDAAGNEVRDYLRVAPHHRAADGVTGVAVLPVARDAFGLIRIFRHAIGAHVWEVVRGFIDEGEAPAAAAARELREEAGMEVDAGKLRELGLIAPEPGLLDARVRLFAAEGSVPVKPARGSEMGHDHIEFFSRKSLVAMLDGGDIVDPCTLACCYRYLGVAS